MDKIIVFENLNQPHKSGIIGLTQNVKAIRPPDGGTTDLWQPANIEEVGARAQQSGERLQEMLPS